MKSLILLVSFLHPRGNASFAFVSSQRGAQDRRRRIKLGVEAGGEDPVADGYFQMTQIPTATTGNRLDRIVGCSENSECNVEEMAAMIDELERLNAECFNSTTSRECKLDVVAARNVLKVALARKIITGETIKDKEDCIVPDPYADMYDMKDERLFDVNRPIPTVTTETTLDRVVQCANAWGCPIGEITEMIDELERLNMECESTLSRECSLDAVEARNILKVALGAQAAVVNEMINESGRP